MGKQLRIMQSSQDIADLWAAIPDRFSVAAIPWHMDSSPENFWRPEELANDSLLLFCATDWEELRVSIAPGISGCHQLSPRTGVVEWSRTEVRDGNQYIVGSRIYIQEADVPWSAASSRLFDWTLRWIKRHYFLAPALRTPIAIGPRLVADIEAGRATAIYPNGKPVIST
jgi:hypothetical protein